MYYSAECKSHRSE